MAMNAARNSVGISTIIRKSSGIPLNMNPQQIVFRPQIPGKRWTENSPLDIAMKKRKAT